tara:strand:+ start:156 stop:329 length:174 start_codon:yes stop_codon:yes gene_type:complete
MLSPIKLSTLRIDTGRPLVIIDLVDGEDNKIFLTETDMEILQKYFEYALDYLEMSKP